MKSWLEDLLTLTAEAQGEAQWFAGIARAAQSLGFAYCAYGLSCPLPLGHPRSNLLHNFPPHWSAQSACLRHLLVDPAVRLASLSQTPLVWCTPLPQDAPQLWQPGQACGWYCGWAHCSLDALGAACMLTLLRGTEPVADAALASQLAPLRWLAQVAQLHLAPAMRASLRQNSGVRLTAREVEVLRWTADGKSTRDVADILQVSTNTVGFHIKNAMAKLQSCNKTASVVQAALLGYLY